MKTSRISVIRQLAKQNNCSVRTIQRAIAKGKITWTDEENHVYCNIKINKAKSIRYNHLEYLNISNCKTLLDMQESRIDNYYKGSQWQSEEMTGYLREHISFIDGNGDMGGLSFDWFDNLVLSTFDSFFKKLESEKKLKKLNPTDNYFVAEISKKELFESVFVGSDYDSDFKNIGMEKINKSLDKINHFNKANMQVRLTKLDKSKNSVKQIVNDTYMLNYCTTKSDTIIYREPAIGQIARVIKHLVSIPVEMLDYGRNSLKTQAIKTYIAYRIVLGNCEKNKLKKAILLSTIKRDIGYDCEKDYAKKYMEFLKGKGYVNTYEITDDNISWTVQQN